MWTITIRDLQFRRRRFIIAVFGTALVFGMALIMSGMAAGFRVEAASSIKAVGADAWVVRAGTSGPFTAFTTVTPEIVAQVGRQPGVAHAEALIVARRTMPLAGGGLLDVNMLGYALGGIVEPPVVTGRVPSRTGEVAIDDRSKMRIGSRLVLGGRELRVVGVMHGISWFGGIPGAFIPIEDVQAMIFEGRPLGTTIITSGIPINMPTGYAALSSSAARADMLRPIENGMNAISNIQMLLWIVAAMIIGAVVYLSALERVRDFAVLKALGGSSRALFGGLVAQAVIVAMIAVAFATLIAVVLAPRFALPINIPKSAFALLPAIGMTIGSLASLSGLRRAVSVDPALAFGGP
ncbi:MAG: ABC transporter permease [Actinomycetota bacterium]|nr:ABC transporter permease [Actinomycetota bacterium]